MPHGGRQKTSMKHNGLKFIPFRFVCHGLTTGSNYVFRVKAVNAAGYSQNSPNSDAVVVLAAICECHFLQKISPMFTFPTMFSPRFDPLLYPLGWLLIITGTLKT